MYKVSTAVFNDHKMFAVDDLRLSPSASASASTSLDGIFLLDETSPLLEAALPRNLQWPFKKAVSGHSSKAGLTSCY